jgi:predicted RNase H-like HicB family nuclease
MKSINNYNVIYKPEPEGGFTAIVPSLPGCVTYGETLEQAQAIAKDAIIAYLASMKKHKEGIPTDTNTFISTIAAYA